jgi:hypothetical protein
MKTFKNLTLILSIVFAAQNYSFAQEVEKKASPVSLLIGGALEFGGDQVAEVYFTDGKTQSVKAGQGVSLAVGGQLQLPKLEKFLLRATVGYKYVTTMATNANIRLTRVPIHLTANWMATKNIRLGAGLAKHQIIRFKADGLGDDAELTGSTAPIFEVAYRGFGLTYTAMKYKDQQNSSYSANAIGIAFSTTFPRR